MVEKSLALLLRQMLSKCPQEDFVKPLAFRNDLCVHRVTSVGWQQGARGGEPPLFRTVVCTPLIPALGSRGRQIL